MGDDDLTALDDRGASFNSAGCKAWTSRGFGVVTRSLEFTESSDVGQDIESICPSQIGEYNSGDLLEQTMAPYGR